MLKMIWSISILSAIIVVLKLLDENTMKSTIHNNVKIMTSWKKETVISVPAGRNNASLIISFFGR